MNNLNVNVQQNNYLHSQILIISLQAKSKYQYYSKYTLAVQVSSGAKRDKLVLKRSALKRAHQRLYFGNKSLNSNSKT